MEKNSSSIIQAGYSAFPRLFNISSTSLSELLDPCSNPQKELPKFTPILPQFVQDCIANAGTDAEKLMLLGGVITVSSSLFAGVSFEYRGTLYHPNLSMLVIAPSGSGKGKLRHALSLTKLIDEKIAELNKLQIREYKEKKKRYDIAQKNNTITSIVPEEPAIPLFSFSGNMTSAALINQLYENKGKISLMISDLELDTVYNSSKGDHGKQLSPTLRKITENETVSVSTKYEGTKIITSPKASILFATTPNQLFKMFNSNDDGFYSRFLIIRVDNTQNEDDFEIMPKSTGNEGSLNDRYSIFSKTFFEYFEQVVNKDVAAQFTHEQYMKLQAFGKLLEKLIKEDPKLRGNENAAALGRRHINMCFRMAATLEMLNYCQNKCTSDQVEISEDILEFSLWFTMTSLQSSLELFKSMPEEQKKGKRFHFYELLPKNFNRDNIIQVSQTLGVRERTGYSYTEKLKELGMVKDLGYNNYEKIEAKEN